ncbi:hypothetical protein, partial [Brevundimonas sp.]|uniref:hypothetical protein n=1 Tax=Brevundimonas sp. TaxID=1871086 RepID=UPI002730659F
MPDSGTRPTAIDPLLRFASDSVAALRPAVPALWTDVGAREVLDCCPLNVCFVATNRSRRPTARGR